MPCSDCSPSFAALAKLKERKLLSISRANEPPIASERTELRELVSHAEEELVQYRQTIARLHEMIIALENDKENLEGEVHIAKSLFAPIRKLSPEILREIFITHAGESIVLGPESANIPGFKVAAICSYWRSIAVEMPDLWNRISVKVRRQKQVDHLALVEHLLRLSGRSKLDIIIESKEGFCGPAHPHLLSLCEQSNRWRTLNGHCKDDVVIKTLSSLQGHVDSLKASEINIPFVDFCALVKGAPNLRTAFVYNIKPSSTDPPWTHIIKLTLHESDLSNILQSIPQMPKLSSLNVDFPYLDEGDNDSMPEHPVRCDLHLLRMFIDERECEIAMTKLFGLLTLPKLESLCIVSKILYKANDEKRSWSSNELPSFISRASAPITSFSLVRALVSTSDLITLLTSMPALTTLSLAEPSRDASILPMLNDHLLSNIQYRQGRRPILARLTSLTLEGCLLSHFSIPLFAKVIHSRWKPSILVGDQVACIKTVRLEVPSDSIDRGVVKSLMLLRTRGLDISIKDENGEVPLWEEE